MKIANAAVAACVLAGGLIGPVQAQSARQVDAVLDRVFAPLKALPFPNCGASSWSTAVDALRAGLTAPANGWRSSSNTCGLQLFIEQIPAAGLPSGAAVYVVFDKDLKVSDIPGLSGAKWRNVGDARLSRPIFSIASVERTLITADPNMPAALRGLFGGGSRYGGLQQFSVPIGPQVFTHAAVLGAIGNVLKTALNAPVDNMWIRAGFASESASDLVNREGNKFMELMMPPGTVLSGPLGVTEAQFTDVTILVDDAKNLSAMGNMSFQSASPGKVFPAVIELPSTDAGTVDWSKSQMALSTPSVITLEEFAKVSMALNTQVAGGGMVSQILPTKPVLDRIAMMFKPLSAFKVRNPSGNADSFRLRAGQGYPDLRQFNFVIVGPQATTKDDAATKGPMILLDGIVTVLGKDMTRTKTSLSRSGLITDTKADMRVNLSRVGLGEPGFTATAKIHLDESRQQIFLDGPIPVMPDRKLTFTFDATQIAINSPATCTAPIDVGGRIALDRAPDISAVLSALQAVQPDPKKLVSCATSLYYLVSDGVVYVFDGSKQLMSMAADAFPADQIAKFGNKGLKLVGGAFVDAGNEALDVGKKIGGAVGGAATKVAGSLGDAAGDAKRLAEEAAKASARAAEEAGRAASQAAQAAANAAANAARNAAGAASGAVMSVANNTVSAANAVGRAFGMGGPNTCDQRMTWLNSRSNAPTVEVTESLINAIYLPLKVKAAEARAVADHINRYAQPLAQSHEGFRAMEIAWNSRMPKTPIGTLQSFHENESHIFDYTNRVQLLRINSAVLESGGQDFTHLIAWRTYAPHFRNPPGWRPANAAEQQWVRCAAAWTADIPVRTADIWKIPYPKHKGVHSDVMFMDNADYVRLRERLAGYVHERGVYTTQSLDWVIAFAGRWTTRTMRFQSALLAKFDEAASPVAGRFRVQPPTAPAAQAAWKEYVDAVAAYRAQTEGMVALAQLPNQQQATATIDRVVRAIEGLRKVA